MSSEKLQIVVSFGSESPRIFSIDIGAPVSDLREAISAGARAFYETVQECMGLDGQRTRPALQSARRDGLNVEWSENRATLLTTFVMSGICNSRR